VWKWKFATERLDKVKDIFMFSCFTGLAYSDVKKINSKDIVTGVDGKRWLFISRTKTGNEILILNNCLAGFL